MNQVLNSTLLGGLNGMYLMLSVMLGLELAFDVFRLRKTPITPMMRIGGLAMVYDGLAVIFGGFLAVAFPAIGIFPFIAHLFEILVLVSFCLLGFALLSGTYPSWKQQIIVVVPVFAIVIGIQAIPSHLMLGTIILDVFMLVIYCYIGYKIYLRDKKLEHFYSNLDNLRSSWFAFYILIVIIEMPLYLSMQILHLAGLWSNFIFCFVMMSLYLFMARKISMQDSGMTTEEMEKVIAEYENTGSPLMDTPETEIEDSEEISEPKEEETVEEKTEETKGEVEEIKEDTPVEPAVETIIEEPKAEEPKAEEKQEEKAEDKVDSYLTMGQQKAFAEKLRRLMEEEKAFKNPDLTVEDLKAQLRTNSAYFYYFMRDVIKMKFYEYVNTYRVEEAKRLLGEGDYTMEYIALTTGFNSYNSFVRTFKKFTGVTPSKWAA